MIFVGEFQSLLNGNQTRVLSVHTFVHNTENHLRYHCGYSVVVFIIYQQKGRGGEGFLVAKRGDIETTSVHLGRNLAGRLEEENIWKDCHALGSGGRWDGRLGSWNDGTDTGDA